MKIAFMVSSFPALSQTFVLNQVTGLIDHGHEVDIFAEYPGEKELSHPEVARYNLLDHTYYFGDVDGISSDRTYKQVMCIAQHLWTNSKMAPGSLLQSLSMYRQCWSSNSLQSLCKSIAFLGKGKDYDIFICHFGPNGLVAAQQKAVGAIQGKIITVFHGYDMSKHLKQHGDNVYQELFRAGDLFLPISVKWQEELIRIGCDPAKIIVHRMGVDSNIFKPAIRDEDGRLKIVSVGRLVEKKGMEFAIRAVSEVARGRDDLSFRIAGDGPLKDELEVLIKDLGAQGKIELLGWQTNDEIAKLMCQSDLLLAPSVTDKNGDMEGIPVVLMEAMAQEIPVVSTWHSGIPELVQDQVAGLLVKERDVDALAGQLRFMLDHPEKRKEYGRNGRKIVEEHFNIKTLNVRLEEICLQTIQETRTHD